ncbi:hypothetical protein [Wukongibacter sp. M2B1]|uniref:hypothetical protein n=1 Tax=Wukongibacter sp. M2B1 TaxID=3088895 RepID=UPI003D7A0673
MAYIGGTSEKVQKTFDFIIKKFLYLKDLSGDPSDFVGVRVELDKIMLTDNTIEFWIYGREFL